MTTPATAPVRLPRYDPHVPLRAVLLARARSTQTMQASQDGPLRSWEREQVVHQSFAARDVHRFKSLIGASNRQGAAAIHSGLNTLDEAGLGAMASADALAWLHVAHATGAAEDLPRLVAQWEQYTNHGWLAHVAGLGVEEIRRAGAAPGDDQVQWLLALQGGDIRRRAPKVRTIERLGPLTTS